MIPEAFLATDAILLLMGNIVTGMEIYPRQIRKRIERELPFMATEELIVRAVRAGRDRQVAHEVIRRHSLAAARAMKEGADTNDMLDRLASDPEFGLPLDDLRGVLSPERFVGRAPQQVDDFLAEVVEPLLAGAMPAQTTDEIRV